MEDDKVFDASPHLKLFIDKDGQWFQNDAKIIHPQIYKLFNENLRKRNDGSYELSLGREICTVEVEDAPFVVSRVHTPESAPVKVELNDGTVETFDPDNFWIGPENTPYCLVKDGEFHARFSRPAYYQIAKYIKTGDSENEFVFDINGKITQVADTPKI
jgi:hypothetical protein